MKRKRLFSLYLTVALVVMFCGIAVGGDNLVVNPGFEIPEGTSGGTPGGFGDWGYDWSEIVGPSLGIFPLEGEKILQFNGTFWRAGTYHGGGGQVYQFIDLSAFAEKIDTGEFALKASVNFNRVTWDSQTDTRFKITMHSFTGSIGNFRNMIENEQWLMKDMNELYTDNDLTTWEKVELQHQVPAGTEWVALGIIAEEDIFNDNSHPEFDGHFADAVTVEIIPAVEPSLILIEISGPNEVAESSDTPYQAIAVYDNGSEEDVTDECVWAVGPDTFCSIDETGMLSSYELVMPEQMVTVWVQYEHGEEIFLAEKEVSIHAICPKGSALEFDGVDDYVDAGDMGDFGRNISDCTLAAWVNTNNQDSIMSILGVVNTGLSTQIRLDLNYNAVGEYADGYIALFVRDENGRRLSGSVNYDTGVADGQWHHVAVVFQSSSNIIKFYLDGTEEPTTYKRRETPGNYGNFIRSLLIGAVNRSIGPNYMFDGNLDEVTLLNRALSGEEIQHLISGIVDVDDPELIAYWDFDEGEGQVAHDVSGNGNDGVLGSSIDPDVSDPCWVAPGAPMLCTPRQVIVRNLHGAIERKRIAEQQIDEALMRERASLRLLLRENSQNGKGWGFGRYGKPAIQIFKAMRIEWQCKRKLHESAKLLKKALMGLLPWMEGPEQPGNGNGPKK